MTFQVQNYKNLEENSRKFVKNHIKFKVSFECIYRYSQQNHSLYKKQKAYRNRYLT